MSEWISIKERIPPEGTRVLTYDSKNKEQRVDYIIHFPEYKTPYIWACRIDSDYNKVDFWMLLPEPPNIVN
jgi:hypothetical protein